MTMHFNFRVSFEYSFLENGLSLELTKAVISQKETIHTIPKLLYLSVVSMFACCFV